jgi:hypothetical protein
MSKELYRELYSKYSPGLSEDELNSKVSYAVGQDPSEFVNAFYQKYTGTGPSEAQANYINNFTKDTEKDTWLEDIFGGDNYHDWKDEQLRDAPDEGGIMEKVKDVTYGALDWTSDISRALKAGFGQAGTLDSSLNLHNKGIEGMTEEEKTELVKDMEASKNIPRTQEMVSFDKEYEEMVKEHGGIAAFFLGWKKNPTVMTQYSAQSMGMMVGALGQGETLGTAASWAVKGGAAGFASSKLGQKLMKAKNPIVKLGGGALSGISMGKGAVGGFMGGISKTMEKGFTTMELIDEQATEEYGDAWNYGTDKEKLEILANITSNKETYDIIKSKSVARGNTIGFVDAVTGVLTMGAINRASRAASVSRLSRFSKPISYAAGAAVETAGGVVSEIGGQIAAGQDIDPKEYLLEGFADKTFTMGTAVKKGIRNNPKYSINGESMNGAKFQETIKSLDDDAFVGGDFEIENSPVMQQIVDNRQGDIRIDENINSRINDVKDRSRIIEIERELKSLEGKDTNSIGIQRKELRAEAAVIEDKYIGNKDTVSQDARKSSIANSRQNKFDRQYNKNSKKFAAEIAKGKKILGDKLRVFDTQEEFEKKMQELDPNVDLNELKNTSGTELNGKVYINKAKALNNGNINVVAHEILHVALEKHVKSIQGKKAITKFYNSLDRSTREAIDQNMKAYTDKQKADAPDEILAQYLDLVADKNSSVDINPSTLGKLEDFINSFLESVGLKDVARFESASDVRKFLVDYKTKFNSSELKVGDSKKTGKRKFSKVNLDQGDGTLENKINALTLGAKTKVEFQGPKGGFGTVYEAIVLGDLDRLITNVNNTQKDLIREELGIRLAGRPKSAKKIAELEAKGMTEEEIAAGYDPAKATLYKWFGSNIAQSKMVANKALFKDSENKGPSLDEAKKNAEGDSFATQMEDTTELSPEEITDLNLAKERKTKAAPKKAKETLRRKMGFERNGDAHNTIKNGVKRNVLRNLVITRRALKEDVATGKYKKGDKITEAVDITDLRWQKELGRNLGIDLQNLMMERMGRSAKDYVTFLDQFIEESFAMMDQNAINNRFAGLVVKVVNKQNSKMSALDMKVKSKTAGNALFEKRVKTKEELIEYFLVRGRKNSLAQVLGNEFAYDATMEVLLESDMLSKAENALVNKSGLKGQALISLIAKQINRDPGLKFSKVLTQSEKDQVIQAAPEILKYLKGFAITNQTVIDAITKALPDLNEKSIKGFAKELLNPVRRYLDTELKKKGIITKNVDFATFAFESINLAIKSVEVKINKLTGNKIPFTDLFKDANEQAITRSAVKNYFKDSMTETKMVDGKEVKVPITDPAKRAKILHALMRHKAHNTTGGKRFQERYQSFSSAKDFYDNTFGFIPGVTVVGSKTAGGMSYAIYDGGVKVKFPPALAQSSKEMIKGKPRNISRATWEVRYEKWKNAAQENFDEVNRYLAYIAKTESSSTQAMMSMSMKQGMKSMLKAAARVEYYFEGNYKGELMFEHMVPTEKALFDLFSFHKGNKKYSLEQIQEQYVVAIIPKTMDNNMNVIFRQDRLASFDYAKDNASLLYYNPATFGFTNMYAMKSLSGKGEVMGKQWSGFKGSINSLANRKALNTLAKINDIRNMYSRLKPPVEKGMSVFDFDDTLAQSNSKVLVTAPDGSTKKINATEFALESADLEAAGATFDFSQFNKVIDGKKGPFFNLAEQIQGKFGNKNIFILTARPQEAAYSIHAFLKGLGLDIPIDNITGLEDGKASAKADWVIDKVADGYNNILFADDAIKNVKAVKEVLEIADVKSDVRQAKMKFSKTLDENFNNILEKKSGINKNEEFSKASGKAAGIGKGKYKFWMPPSAEDFLGLMYNILPAGKAGEISLKFLNQALIDPYWAGVKSLNAAKQALGNDFSALKKRFPKAFKSLLKDVGHKQYSNEQAIRVYLWNKAGFKVPGMSQVDVDTLSGIVRNNNNMRGFADIVGATTNLKEGYVKPNDDWVAGTIAYDYFTIAQKTNRKKFLAGWVDAKNEIFSEKNLNKIEAIYGEDYRSALEDIIWRMENGTNRTTGKNKMVNAWMNWVNNSVGAIMFFNSRSAVLQTISMINFINWSDNNPLKAGMAFANQKQFWSDFSMIFNSDMLKQRRSGLQSDVNEAEIAQAVAGKTDKASAAISYLLKKGFLPTQMADSFAISMGGASFFRNRFNTYKSQGMTDMQAKEKAFTDFAKTSEESQQSADPALISQQQAGPLGRLILAFQNTPMQYARLIKKAVLDIKYGRGDVKTNISKILYYGVIQNIIFSTLQSGLFALAFDDEEDEKLTQKLEDKKLRALNTSLDSLLRGGGVYGAAISTIKNMILQFNKQNDKGYRADHAYTMMEAINLSPPVGSKARKIYSATQTYKFNKKIIPGMGMSINNPAYLLFGNLVSAATNIPLDRAIMKLNNLIAATDSQNQAWQRVATFLGWNTWDVGIKNTAVEEAKAKAKKTTGKIKRKYRK